MKGSIALALPVAALLFFGTFNTKHNEGTATPPLSKPSITVFPTQYRPWFTGPATYSWPGSNALVDAFGYDGVIRWDGSPYMRLHLGDTYPGAHEHSYRSWMNQDQSICFDHLLIWPGSAEQVEAEVPTEEAPYQERVLAHLRASLILPSAFPRGGGSRCPALRQAG